MNHAIRHLTADGTPSVNKAYTSEEYLKVTEEQLKASASQQQDQTASPAESQLESQNQQEGWFAFFVFFFFSLSLSYFDVIGVNW